MNQTTLYLNQVGQERFETRPAAIVAVAFGSDGTLSRALVRRCQAGSNDGRWAARVSILANNE